LHEAKTNESVEMVTRNLLNLNVELPSDVKLYAGIVFNSAPHRHKSSRWYVPLEEYSYNKWPTYITAGVFLLSREALQEMYCASLYTKHFR
jgi:beta-1,3-galactosyltransferase / beta-1,3-N-acetylglucosaminyltransferase